MHTTPYIDNIRGHVITKWANGKFGEIAYFEREIGKEFEIKYRFIEINPQNMQYVHGIEARKTKSPIVAEGIVAFWLNSKDGVAINNIFEDYSQQCQQAYVKSQQGRIESWNINLEKQFYLGYHMNEEKQKMLNSEEIFPFVGIIESRQIKKLMKAYKKFVKRRRLEIILWRPIQSIWNIIKGFVGLSVGV